MSESNGNGHFNEKVFGKSEDKREEWNITVAMITNATFLGSVAQHLQHDVYLDSPACQMICKLCLEYWKEFAKPPGRSIEDILRERLETNHTDANVEKNLWAILDQMDREAEKQGELNVEYLLKVAGKRFNLIAGERMADRVKAAAQNGDLERMQDAITNYQHVEVGEGAGIDLFRDEEAIKRTFAERTKSLFSYGDESLDLFFQEMLVRNSFLGVMASEKIGKCVSGSMEVVLADGRVRKIRDLVKSREKVSILSYDEESQRLLPVPVSQFWDNGKKECWEVRTKSGRRIVTTSNHQYLTPDGWKYLETIRVGDFIATPKRINFFGNKRVDENELKFLAFMLADGCCRAQPNFTKTDPETVGRFESCCDALGIEHRRKNISTFLKGALPLIDRLGLRKVLSKEKTIPDFVFSCPKDQVALFLRTFFSCDGYVLKGGHIGVGLASRKMVRQISHLLLWFGIVHKFNYSPSSCNGKTFDSWEICINSDEYVELFLREINFFSYKWREPTPPKKLKSFLDKFPAPVAKQFLVELEQEYENLPVPQRLGGGVGMYVRFGHAFRQMFGTSKAAFVRGQITKGLPIMRQSFCHVDPDSPTFQKYMGSDILWDEVVSIRCVGKKDTYDLGVEKHHNFVANDCVVHNSYLLSDMAFRAMCQKCRVAYFQVGDLSEKQIIERFLVRAAKHPIYSPGNVWPCTLSVPTGIHESSRNKQVEIAVESLTFDRPLGLKKSSRVCKELNIDLGDRSYFQLACFPNNSVTIHKIKGIIEGWTRQDFTPDVIFIDYSDILAPTDKKIDRREQTNYNWTMMKNLSVSMHCLVVTATQTNADAYSRKLLNRSNFSEDHRKLAHVDGLLAINVQDSEKASGLSRLNWIVKRHTPYQMDRPLHLAGNLALANPAMVAAFL